MGGDGQALTNKRSLLVGSLVYGVDDSLQRRASANKNVCDDAQQRWRHCALSLEKIEAPVAFDLQGDLYSMQSVIDHLQRRRSYNTGPAAPFDDNPEEGKDREICKLSDVRQVCDDACDPGGDGSITCPITHLLASTGKHSFVGFWGCGHVVAATALGMDLPKISAANASKGEMERVCPLCDVPSIPVQLVLPREKAAEQRKRLRRVLGLHKRKKRARVE